MVCLQQLPISGHFVRTGHLVSGRTLSLFKRVSCPTVREFEETQGSVAENVHKVTDHKDRQEPYYEKRRMRLDQLVHVIHLPDLFLLLRLVSAALRCDFSTLLTAVLAESSGPRHAATRSKTTSQQQASKRRIPAHS